MSQVEAKYEKFKELLQHNADLSVVTHAMFDLLETKGLLGAGKTGVKCKMLMALLPEVSKKIFGRKIKPKEELYCHVPNLRLYHGSCRMMTGQVVMVYLEDLSQGLIALWDMKTGQNHMLRVTGTGIVNGPAFLANPLETASD